MTAQQLAQAILPLLERVQVPMTQVNLENGAKLYATLGLMANGQLILTPANPVPLEGTPHAK